MDELLMNVNLNHRGDRDDSSSYSSINVTVVDTVESIIDLSRKRKVRDNCNQLNFYIHCFVCGKSRILPLWRITI